MDKQTQAFHQKRRRIDQFINAAVLRLRTGAQRQDTEYAQRAAEDLAQAVDELLDLLGGHQLTAPTDDCPDCGQVIR